MSCPGSWSRERTLGKDPGALREAWPAANSVETRAGGRTAQPQRPLPDGPLSSAPRTEHASRSLKRHAGNRLRLTMSCAGALSPGRRGLVSPRWERWAISHVGCKRDNAGNVPMEPHGAKPRFGAHAVVTSVTALLGDLALCWHREGPPTARGPPRSAASCLWAAFALT